VLVLMLVAGAREAGVRGAALLHTGLRIKYTQVIFVP
jgi:hypothetical protein